MSNVLTVRKGDTRPRHRVQLTYNDGTAVDLTGATIRYLLRSISSTELTVDGTASIVNSPGTDGICEYEWQTGDTAIAGLYDAEFEVTFGDGTIQTFPTRRPLRVRIVGDLD